MGAFEDILSRFFGDSGVDEPSVEVNPEQQLSALLPWRGFDSERDLYLLDGGYGVALEATPISGVEDAGQRFH